MGKIPGITIMAKSTSRSGVLHKTLSALDGNSSIASSNILVKPRNCMCSIHSTLWNRIQLLSLLSKFPLNSSLLQFLPSRRTHTSTLKRCRENISNFLMLAFYKTVARDKTQHFLGNQFIVNQSQVVKLDAIAAQSFSENGECVQ